MTAQPHSRAALSDAFVQHAGWGKAARGFLAGDASNRRYDRLVGPEGTAVLMDAPPELGEDTRPFIAIAGYLRDQGLSAPQVLAADCERGFLLLEDLGDDLFAHVLTHAPAQEAVLYAAATDVLAHLAQAEPPPDLPRWDAPAMGAAAGLAVSWYGAAVGGSDADPAPLQDAVAAAVAQHAPAPGAIVLRDFHAENLLWLPARQGLGRVGLLDFQSAGLGPAGYDLISMLQDARRDVSAATDRAMRARFAAATGSGAAQLDAALAALGAQRALRILGTFVRLCLRDGKPGYLRLIPRVWAQLQANLAHPALTDVAAIVQADLPPPNPEILTRISTQCAPAPTV